MAHDSRDGRYVGSCAGLLIAVLMLAAVPSSASEGSNRGAIRAYLGAMYEYEEVALANAGEARIGYKALASRIAGECPGVVAGGRTRLRGSLRVRSVGEFEQLNDLRAEVRAALDDALLAPNRQAALVLAAKLRTLRWSSPSVRRQVNGYVMALERRLEQHVPSPCPQMKAWAASGYRAIPPATAAFLREYEPARRLVIRDGPPPARRHMSISPLQREAERHDRSVLLEIRAAKRRLASALGSLASVSTDLERTLGFPTPAK
jgi:hypothetical protein